MIILLFVYARQKKGYYIRLQMAKKDLLKRFVKVTGFYFLIQYPHILSPFCLETQKHSVLFQ